jgi:hypothetical protein
MDWVLPLDEIDFARANRLREQFVTCCEEISETGADPDALSAAIATHLGDVSLEVLPPAAHFVWQERVARPLKADAEKPLTERAINGIRSWPSARASDLYEALRELDKIIEDAVNEAHHVAIYVEISRTYS